MTQKNLWCLFFTPGVLNNFFAPGYVDDIIIELAFKETERNNVVREDRAKTGKRHCQ